MILQGLLGKEKLITPPAHWKRGERRAAFAIAESTLFWPFPGEDKKWVLATSTLVPITQVLGSVVFRDLDGDGRPELVFFVTNGPDLDRVGSTVRIFGTPKSLGDQFLPTEMRQAEYALMGVANEAQLDLALPKLETFEPPDDATPTPRLIGRLSYATDAELRDFISPAGLRLCDDKGKCKHLAKSALVDKTLKETVRPALGELIRYEASSEPDLAGVGSMMIVGCTKSKNALETCELCNGRGLACVPTGVNLVFEGTGKSRRLVEVRAWQAGS